MQISTSPIVGAAEILGQANPRYDGVMMQAESDRMFGIVR